MLICIDNAIVNIADVVLFTLIFPWNKLKSLLNKDFVHSFCWHPVNSQLYSLSQKSYRKYNFFMLEPHKATVNCILNSPRLLQSIRTLDDEEKSDTQLREQFKERWTRTPSAVLTKPMRDEASKYRTILDTAIQADRIVREKYNSHKQAITLLSKPPVSCLSTSFKSYPPHPSPYRPPHSPLKIS